MKTIFGPVCDMIGASVHEKLEQGPRGPIVKRHYQATPAGGLRVIQPERVPVDYAHSGPELGQVVHIERTSRFAWLVAHVDDVSPTISVRVADRLVAVETAMYWSGLFESNLSGRDTVLRGAAITPQPAQRGLEPLRWLDGALDSRSAWKRWNLPDGHERRLLERACAAHLARRKNGGPLVIFDQGHRAQPAPDTPYQRADRPTIEVRSATLGAVSEHRREISAIVAPYGSPALVTIKGQRVREVFAAGAFDAVTKQTNTIRLNLNHHAEDVVGKAIAFDTGRDDGLAATFRVSRTVRGDEALEMAATDLVDCSVGFGVIRESWPQPDLRLVHEGWLDHVALTSQPAYAGARVLGVRERAAY